MASSTVCLQPVPGGYSVTHKITPDGASEEAFPDSVFSIGDPFSVGNTHSSGLEVRVTGAFGSPTASFTVVGTGAVTGSVVTGGAAASC